jgi:hypothetical protein
MKPTSNPVHNEVRGVVEPWTRMAETLGGNVTA